MLEDCGWPWNVLWTQTSETGAWLFGTGRGSTDQRPMRYTECLCTQLNILKSSDLYKVGPMQIPSHEMSHKAATCSSSRSLDCPARDVPSHRAIVVEKSCFWPPISRVCTGYWDRYLLKTLTVPRITAVCCMHVLEYLKSWCAVPSNKFNAPTQLRAAAIG